MKYLMPLGIAVAVALSTSVAAQAAGLGTDRKLLHKSGHDVLRASGRVTAQTVTNLIEGVSGHDTLKLVNGKSISAHISPGMYAVISGDTVIFDVGKPAAAALERQAEDGSPKDLVETLRLRHGVRVVGTFTPGEPFVVTLRPGDRLVFTTMFVQSNDLFYAPRPQGIPLFDTQNRLITGDVTSQIVLWDAGTEVNEAPGIGPNQAPRQARPNRGPTESGVVRQVNDGFKYPDAAEVIRVTSTKK